MKTTTEKTVIHCLLITLLVFLPYSQVAQHRFIEFDDGLYTFLNTYIIKGLSWESITWAFTNTDAANWHPVTWISHLVDRELFGAHAGGYLLMNVAWHILAACCCYVAFLKVTRKRFFAFSVAMIFALHPANVENVAWTSERKSLLDAFFWFLGIIAYVEYLETKKLKFYGLVVITHLLGLMAKAMHVTFPCTLVLIHLLHLISVSDVSPQPFAVYRKSIVASLKLVWPLLVLSVYFSLVTASAQTMAMSNLEIHPLSGRIVNALQSYQNYIRMFFSPGELAPFYPLFYLDQQPYKAITPALCLVAITVSLAFLARKQAIPLLGWFWFLGTMIPVIGLVQVGGQSHADRYLYIPMIGLTFVFPALFEALGHSTIRLTELLRVGWISLTALSLGAATYIQAGYWKDGVSLFQHSLAVTGDCVTSVNCLSCAYLRNERYAEAVAFLDRKILIAKNPLNKAKFYSLKSQAEMALEQYEASIESANKAIALGRGETITYWLLANAYYKSGKKDLAKNAITTAKKLVGQPNRTMLVEVQIQSGIQHLADLLEETSSAEASEQALKSD